MARERAGGRLTGPVGPARLGRERGSAVAEFVMVSALVVVLALGAFQLALGLYVRNTMLAAAAEGARRAALAGAQPADGVARTQEMLGQSLRPGYAESVRARVGAVDGLAVVSVTVTAPLPVLGLVGPSGSLVVTGRAVLEEQP